MTSIKDFKEGDSISGIYLVNNVVKGKTNNGSDYLSIKLQDSSGEIDAKIWQVSAEQMNDIKNGVFIDLVANVIKYREALQLKVESTKVVAESDVNLENFVKKAPIEKNDLRNELQQFIYEIDDRIINIIVSEMIKKYEPELLNYPAAAKIHHAYGSGLLYHIVSMLRLAQALINLYPSLNKNYLYAGIILHDLGKIEELSGVVATEYTTKGKLLGHISIIHSQIQKIAEEINEQDSEQVMIVEHLVLSHHGKYEYGSPVLPMIKEAEILTYIDNIDARMDTLENALESVEPGNFSTRLYALDNRSFYKPINGNSKGEK
ncbi:HD domain-containing protein [Erysipelotrichaceae bacterium OttesenSCG-928-M19]|nr:HD domain-containing protein [Erysipelotrichaceae bacterium OttesenSCG-928-M19]